VCSGQPMAVPFYDEDEQKAQAQPPQQVQDDDVEYDQYPQPALAAADDQPSSTVDVVAVTPAASADDDNVDDVK